MTFAAGTVGTGALTTVVTCKVKEPAALTPAKVAVIVAEPFPTTEMTPNSLTLATSTSVELNVKYEGATVVV